MPEKTQEYVVRSTLPPLSYPDIPAARYLADSFLAKDENFLAFIDPKTGAQLTYGQLHLQAQYFASSLAQIGITKSDLVLFFADNCIEYAVAMFGTIYLGVTVSQVKPANGAYELAEQIKDSQGTVLMYGVGQLPVLKKVLNSEDYCDSIAQLKMLVQIDDQLDDNNNCDPFIVEHPVCLGKQILTYQQVLNQGSGHQLASIPHYPVESLEKDPFVICYTSGTTGKAKGAVHTNRSYVALLMNLKHPAESEGRSIAIPYPLGHISGTFFVPQALDRGMTAVMFDNADVDTVVEAISWLRINEYFFSANAGTPLAANDYPEKYDLSCLKVFRYGGAKIAGHLLEVIKKKYNVAMWELYGATEFLGSTGNVDPADTLDNWVPGNVGQVLPNVELKIVDLADNAKSLPANEIGEICFRGAPCFAGYLNNPKATSETIDEDGWYHSGDVGYYTEQGKLFTADRIKELIKFRIWSVIPAEIEEFLLKNQSVWAVCVVGVPHVIDGNWIRAYVQLAEGKKATEQELKDSVKENMGYQKRLRGGVRFIEEMPRTAVGKVDRQYFRKLANLESLTDNEKEEVE